MEVETQKNYCAFTVYLEGYDEEGKDRMGDTTESIQEAFKKFRRRRQVRIATMETVP